MTSALPRTRYYDGAVVADTAFPHELFERRFTQYQTHPLLPIDLVDIFVLMEKLFEDPSRLRL